LALVAAAVKFSATANRCWWSAFSLILATEMVVMVVLPSCFPSVVMLVVKKSMVVSAVPSHSSSSA
jgi:hypothetical protein